ncbi:hypothetical protein HK099_001505, partial [Clydaea vesicula]
MNKFSKTISLKLFQKNYSNAPPPANNSHVLFHLKRFFDQHPLKLNLNVHRATLFDISHRNIVYKYFFDYIIKRFTEPYAEPFRKDFPDAVRAALPIFFEEYNSFCKNAKFETFTDANGKVNTTFSEDGKFSNLVSPALLLHFSTLLHGISLTNSTFTIKLNSIESVKLGDFCIAFGPVGAVTSTIPSGEVVKYYRDGLGVVKTKNPNYYLLNGTHFQFVLDVSDGDPDLPDDLDPQMMSFDTYVECEFSFSFAEATMQQMRVGTMKRIVCIKWESYYDDVRWKIADIDNYIISKTPLLDKYRL